MARKMVCSLALGAALMVPPAGSAQTFVDVGVWTGGGGGRVVIGSAPVYHVPVYHAPVYHVPIYRAPVYRPVYVALRPVYVERYYVQPYYQHDRGRHKGWGKNNKGRHLYAGDYGYYDAPLRARPPSPLVDSR